MIKFFQKLLLIVSILMICENNFAQNYSINNGFTNNGTVTTCSGFFYDSNISGNYAASERYNVTFCSGNVGKVMQLEFSQLSIGLGDTLFVIDGNNTNNNVLDTFTNITFSATVVITVSDTNTTGCLTF
jgi:hypothetical protein